MRLLLSVICLAIAAVSVPARAATAESLAPIRHIIVISLENHSFDNLFGQFPGAEGLNQAQATSTQTDPEGKPYRVLPPVMDTRRQPPQPDSRFPAALPNAPFAMDGYVPPGEKTGDLVHRFYQHIAQINHGKMDRFAAISDAGGLTMGYYEKEAPLLWRYGKAYTVADHFFHAAFGGSFLNHFWLICACTPHYGHAPPEAVIQLDTEGRLLKDGAVTPEGDAVNTLYPSAGPHPVNATAAQLLPPQIMPTIGDRLSQKNVSWAWYAGGWNAALSGRPDGLFQFHHQPFAYFAAYASGTEAGKEHLKDEADFLRDLAGDTLPAVAFYKPLGEFNLHPGYAEMSSGEAHLAEILKAVEASPAWKSSVVIVTFDEGGGFWDHVPPLVIDRFGPGVRVPTLVISPFAKKGFVDHTVYDTTSILKLIETRFGLPPLGSRDAQAADLTDALTLH
ncbi:MAG: acid phosphatase [Alphaproteobacteria bacterium]|nr:acid phosphatase [Alphaproteobacteria bacterium]